MLAWGGVGGQFPQKLIMIHVAISYTWNSKQPNVSKYGRSVYRFLFALEACLVDLERY